MPQKKSARTFTPGQRVGDILVISTPKKSRSKAHPTHLVCLPSGEYARIDVEIVSLVRKLNTIPGVCTMYSCQGDEGPAYVSFFPNDAAASFLARMIVYLNRLAKVLEQKGDLAKHSFYFVAEIGPGCVMRWFQHHYAHILDATEFVGQMMKDEVTAQVNA